jgi:hypothetical protein
VAAVGAVKPSVVGYDKMLGQAAGTDKQKVQILHHQATLNVGSVVLG